MAVISNKGFFELDNSTTEDNSKLKTNYKKSPIVYLSKYFSKSTELLECMLFNDISIVGELAVNFFVPDFIYLNNTYKFCTSYNEKKIYNFMNFMKELSVTWLSNIEAFNIELNDTTKISNISAQGLRTLIIDESISLKDSELKEKAIQIFRQFEKDQYTEEKTLEPDEYIYITIKNNIGSNKVFRVYHELYPMFGSIHGKMNYCGNVHNIILFIADESLCHTLLNFGISVDQCAITGFCAFHMYPEDIYSHKITVWDGSDSNYLKSRNDCAENLEKYTTQGIDFSVYPGSSTAYIYNGASSVERRISDLNTHVINFDIYGSKYKVYLEYKLKLLKLYSWIQVGNTLLVNAEAINFVKDTVSCNIYSHITDILLRLTENTNESIKYEKLLVECVPEFYNIYEKTINNIELGYKSSILPIEYLNRYILKW